MLLIGTVAGNVKTGTVDGLRSLDLGAIVVDAHPFIGFRLYDTKTNLEVG